MADVKEAFELCKVFSKDTIVGMEHHCSEDVVILTSADRGVLVYNVSIFRCEHSARTRASTSESSNTATPQIGVFWDLLCQQLMFSSAISKISLC